MFVSAVSVSWYKLLLFPEFILLTIFGKISFIWAFWVISFLFSLSILIISVFNLFSFSFPNSIFIVLPIEKSLLWNTLFNLSGPIIIPFISYLFFCISNKEGFLFLVYLFIYSLSFLIIKFSFFFISLIRFFIIFWIILYLVFISIGASFKLEYTDFSLFSKIDFLNLFKAIYLGFFSTEFNFTLFSSFNSSKLLSIIVINFFSSFICPWLSLKSLFR